MTLTIRARFPKNAFELLGSDENSATFALGWALDRSPKFAALLAERIADEPVESSDMRIALQTHGHDRGFTDMEVRCGRELHAVIEAKRGFALPTLEQLRRYRPRLDIEPAATRALVSVSAIAGPIAARRLPPHVDGVRLIHLSWGALRGLAKQARLGADGFEERLWLRELIRHLEGYAAMERTRDNMVYVVSLGSNAMREDGPRTWIDVVEGDGRYFHPVGDTWPTQPPNYIGFRYRGELRSVHRVESHDIALDVSTVEPSWPKTDRDHFVYALGPPMRPARPLKAASPDDTVKWSARVWCAIDTLLTGQFERLGQARDETKRRLAEAESSED